MSDCPTKKMHSLYRRKKKKKNIFYFFYFPIYIRCFLSGQVRQSDRNGAGSAKNADSMRVCAKVSVKMASRTQLDSVWQLDAKKHRRPFFSGGASYMYQLNGMSSSLIGSTGFSGWFLSGILSSGIMNLRTLIRLP